MRRLVDRAVGVVTAAISDTLSDAQLAFDGAVRDSGQAVAGGRALSLPRLRCSTARDRRTVKAAAFAAAAGGTGPLSQRGWLCAVRLMRFASPGASVTAGESYSVPCALRRTPRLISTKSSQKSAPSEEYRSRGTPACRRSLDRCSTSVRAWLASM
jgi:hypothetical protein